VLNKSLTIVLPVHNGESRLRADVHEMLDLASELTAKFHILIVDDGSIDATYEVAAGLAARYPQITVKRQRHRGGLGPVMEFVRRSVRSDAVMFHDGVTPIDANQMRNVWRRWIAQTGNGDTRDTMAELQQDVCDFADLPAIHAAMERAHGQVLGFHLVAPAENQPACAEDNAGAPASMPRSDAAHLSRKRSIGQIPRLPRPKVLSSIAEFALGE
jgi:glycosyltransferase involved in cell wall biosynthesis